MTINKTKKYGLSVLVGLLLIGVIILSGCIGGCGDLYQNCCKGGVCNAGYSCGSDGKCYECGNFDELCCAGDTCNEGVCSDGKCEKKSAKEDMVRADSLMDAAKERIDKLYEGGIYKITYASIKNKLDLAKIDYEEALKILKNTKTDYDSERKIIETNKIICDASLDYIDAFQDFVIATEHIEKGRSYMMTLDIEGIKKSKYELKLSEKAFNDSLSFTLKAKEKINKISIADIPPESKSKVQEVKQIIEGHEKGIYDNKKMISGMYPYLDALEHILDATDYAKNKKWHSAEVEYKESLLDFSKSKDIFEDLRDSEATEVSSMAIWMHSYIETYMDAISHMESGSRYMDQGKEVSANEEFKKAMKDMQKLFMQAKLSVY